jgi:MscS family membrane protein
VRFIGFGDYSLRIEIFVYTRTTDYGEFRAIQEDLLLRIVDLVERSGTAFAFPSQTAYLGRDSGIDEELAERAVDEVDAMRKEGQLPFPEFADGAVEEMSGSLSYPPEGAIGNS